MIDLPLYLVMNPIYIPLLTVYTYLHSIPRKGHIRPRIIKYCLTYKANTLPRIRDTRDPARFALPFTTDNFGFKTTKLKTPPSSSPQPQLNTDIMFSSRAILTATRAAAPQRVLAPRVLASSQIRSYATPQPASVQPPIALFGLDGTYATALVRPDIPIPRLCIPRSHLAVAWLR